MAVPQEMQGTKPSSVTRLPSPKAGRLLRPARRRCRGEAFERSPKAGRLLTGALRCITAIGCTWPISISRPTTEYAPRRYKLIYYYGEALGSAGAIDEPTTPEWELFDLENDPQEMKNIYHDPANAELIDELKSELERLQKELGDKPHEVKS